MNGKRGLFILLGMVFAASVRAADDPYDCQDYLNPIGDCRIVTIGGYSEARSITLDLAPKDTPEATGSYVVRCQIAYLDVDLGRPENDDELLLSLDRGALLNDWLRDFVKDEYAEMALSDLLEAYSSGAVARDLNERFPKTVEDRMLRLEPSRRFDVRIVKVVIEADGALFDELVRRFCAKNAAASLP